MDCLGADGGLVVSADASTWLNPGLCRTLCDNSPVSVFPYVMCSAQQAGEGKMLVHCQFQCPVGRRPPGLEARSPGADLGDYFGNMAELEAASVDAFRILRRELAGHRLPRRLSPQD